MDITSWKKYAPQVARYGIASVFLIFGIMQWTDPTSWLGYLPQFTHGLGIQGTTLIYINGTFDFLLGLLLALGLLTRVVGAIAFLHLLGIIAGLGWNEITVRDIGLAIIAFSIFLHGMDDWSVDRKIGWSWL